LRAVTTTTAADVLQVSRKSLDNLLGRIGPGAVGAGRQGVERRISVALLEELALTVELSRRAGIPARDAFELARALLGRAQVDPDQADVSPDFIGSVSLGPFVQLGANLRALREDLQARLETAIESVVRRRRGRPANGVRR
jgi:hypothetical protein